MNQLWHSLFLITLAMAVRLDEDPVDGSGSGSSSGSGAGSEEEAEAPVKTAEEQAAETVEDPDVSSSAMCQTCAGGCVQKGVCFWINPFDGGVLDDASCSERGGKWCPGTGSICVANGCKGGACWAHKRCEPESESLTQDVRDTNGGVWCQAGKQFTQTDGELMITETAKDHATRGNKPTVRDIAGEMAAHTLVKGGKLLHAEQVAVDTAIYLSKFQGNEASTPEALASIAANAASDTALSHGGSAEDAAASASRALKARAEFHLAQLKEKSMAEIVDDAYKSALKKEQKRIASEVEKGGNATVDQQHIAKDAAHRAADEVLAVGGKPCEVKRAVRAASTKALGGVPEPKDIAGGVDTNCSEDMKKILTQSTIDDQYERQLEVATKFGVEGELPTVYGPGARMQVAGGAGDNEDTAKTAGEDAAQEAIDAGKSKADVGEAARFAVRAAWGSKKTASIAAGEAAAKTAAANGEDPKQVVKAGEDAVKAAGGSEADAAEVGKEASSEDKKRSISDFWGRAGEDRQELPSLRNMYKQYVGPLPPFPADETVAAGADVTKQTQTAEAVIREAVADS